MSAHACRAAALAAAYGALLCVARPTAVGAQPSPPPPDTRPARERAPVDLTGQWVAVITEDWRWRMVTPPVGDAASIPLNATGRAATAAWDFDKDRNDKRLLQGIWTAGAHSAADAAAHRLARRGHAAFAVRRRESDSAPSLRAATGRRAIAPGRFDGELVQTNAVARRVRGEHAGGRRLAAGSHHEHDGRIFAPERRALQRQGNGQGILQYVCVAGSRNVAHRYHRRERPGVPHDGLDHEHPIQEGNRPLALESARLRHRAAARRSRAGATMKRATVVP